MKKNKKTPMLDPKHKNAQNIENQDYPGEPNSKPEEVKKPTKDDPKKVPESNDPAGYDNEGTVKETPSGQRDE